MKQVALTSKTANILVTRRLPGVIGEDIYSYKMTNGPDGWTVHALTQQVLCLYISLYDLK